MKKNTILSVMSKTLEKLKDKQNYKINQKHIFKKESCPVCNKKKFKKISYVKVYDVTLNQTVICLYCANIFRQMSPTNNWFEACWKQIESKNPKEISTKLEKLRKKRYEFYFQNLNKIGKFKKILDIGSAFGSGIEIFRKKGYTTHCVEPEINRFKVLQKKKFRSFNSTIENLKTKNKYDLIIMSHSLEHCEDINKAIKIVSSLLKNHNSLLYIEVPNSPKCIDFYDNFYLPHRNNFNISNLDYFLTKQGFDIIQTKNLYFSDEGYSIGLVLKKSYKKKRLKKIKFTKNHLLKIEKLYQKKIPIKIFTTPLSIYVDQIKNFFYILKKDKGKFYSKSKKIYFKHI